MPRMLAASALVGAVLIGVSGTGCGRESNASDSEYAHALRAAVSADAVMSHLQRLQDIADAHGGTRQTGTPGYAASVDYVATALRDKGFNVQTPEFDISIFHVENESLTLDGVAVAARAVEYSGPT